MKFNLIYSQQSNQLESELGTAQPHLVSSFFYICAGAGADMSDNHNYNIFCFANNIWKLLF
jgi:hypothetical protein